MHSAHLWLLERSAGCFPGCLEHYLPLPYITTSPLAPSPHPSPSSLTSPLPFLPYLTLPPSPHTSSFLPHRTPLPSSLTATQVSKSQDQLPKSAASSETQRTGVTSSVGSQKRKRVESNETYVPPPNPYLEPEEGEGEVEEPSPTLAWLADASFVDSDGETVGREKLDRAEIIGVSTLGICVLIWHRSVTGLYESCSLLTIPV